MQSHESDSVNEPEFFIDFLKWRNMVYKTNISCMLSVLVTEIIMYFIFKSRNLFLQPVPVYLFRFLILPSAINLTLLLMGRICQKKFHANVRILNAIPVLQLTLLCFMVSSVHHVFAVTFCTFSFPIFLSAIFSDRLLTHAVTLLSFIFLTVSQFIGPYFNGVYSEYLIPQYLVALIALLASFLICTIIVQFQYEKSCIIKESYIGRMEAIRQLNFDQKTGLYGVTAFHSRLDQLLCEGERKYPLALAIFDIDDFKKVNDNFGHANGDQVILHLARLMKEICGERFFPVRFGGEEFIILFSGGEWAEYRKATKHLLVEFAAAEYDFTDAAITISAGISRWEPGCTDENLFSQADRALYRSKATGKNRITVHEDSQCSLPEN